MSNQYSVSRAHRLLICAALDKGEVGQKCFLEWANVVQLGDIDYASQKMLPAILHQLNNDDLSKKILNLIKFTRLRSQTLLESGFRAEDAIKSGAVPVAWATGGAVIASTKVSISTRALDEIGLLVPADKVEIVAKLLQESRFQLLPNPGLVDSSLAEYCKSNVLTFRDTTGAVINIYWHSFGGSSRSPSEAALWGRVSRVTLAGRETFSISPEDLLLQIFAKNGYGNQAHWVIDATNILEATEIDFKLLLSISREKKLWLKAQISLTRLALYRPNLTPVVNRFVAPLLEIAETLTPKNFRDVLAKCIR